MSNFLNNLVARTLNLAPVVQPRITSRFEPFTAPPDQSVEVEAPPPPAEPHVATTKIIESRITEQAPVVVAPQVERERVINTIRNTHVESKHEVVQVPVPVVEKIHERVIEETRINTEKSTDSRLEIRENRIIEPAPAPKAPDPFHPRSKTVVEPAPLTITKEVPVPAPQPVVPRVVEPAQRLQILPAPQVEPTETINVTIGRIDVRAVFSAQAPKTPVRAPSTNALDDYLKQRSEGRR